MRHPYKEEHEGDSHLENYPHVRQSRYSGGDDEEEDDHDSDSSYDEEYDNDCCHDDDDEHDYPYMSW